MITGMAANAANSVRTYISELEKNRAVGLVTTQDGKFISGPENIDSLINRYHDAAVGLNELANRVRMTTQLQTFQVPRILGKYFMQMSVSDYRRDSLLQVARTVPIGVLNLPLPRPLMDQHQVAYEEKPLGTVAGGILNNVWGQLQRGGDAARGQIGGNIPQTVPGVGGAAPGSADGTWEKVWGAVGANLSQLLSKFNIVGADIGAVMQMASGYSPNQFFTILLKGPTYKRYQLAWRFSPRDPEEAKVLKNMILQIKRWQAPGLAGGGALFDFPKIWRLALFPNSQYLFKFKPAVLESFTANYAPNDNPSFFSARGATDNMNAPEGIDIMMSFIEMEYWLDKCFHDNNFPYDTDYGSGFDDRSQL